ncbi:hypothetical protein JQC91_03375 [Jannaschia sp. Os4]|uniref:hypothetical protein n=1 Tax=Jannaschia sp. Os4 TaxID=2807617 RepID=UPI0019392DC9|nr:hypothetical protein [Jannaschia sp. Os4]MBM2575336.1 hypothetical protein [Jannaschia sp. Os4]
MVRDRRPILAAVGIAGLALGALVLHDGDPPMTLAPPATLDLRLLGSLPTFMERHAEVLDLGSVGVEGLRDVDTLYFQALASATDGPDGYALRYDDGACPPVVLPPGRIVAVAYEALWISSVDAVLPMEPLAFADARVMADRLHDAMRDAGWERVFHRPDYDPQTIAEKMGSAHTLARFRVCGQPGTVATITVDSYNDGPSGYSIPPTAVGDPLPEDAPALYLIRIHLAARAAVGSDEPDAEEEVRRLVRARRVVETGSADRAVPLRAWLDDPDWRGDVDPDGEGP